MTGHRAFEAIHRDHALLTYQQAVFARRHHWAISGRSHHGRLPAHVRHRRHAIAHARAAIVGGTETPIEQIPWQVAVFAEFEIEVAGKKEKVRLLCGGSIIDTTHVVTAGHCAFNPVTELRLPPSSFEVVAGASSITKEALEKSTTVQKQLVEGVRIHPYFNYLAETGADDIAVLQLKAPLTLSAAVKAIGLPASTSAPSEGAGVSVSGYGEENPSALEEPNGKLYSLGLALLFPRRCGGEADALFLCAASGAGSSCFGDSGGPVTSALPLTLVGVIDSGEPRFPGGPCAAGTVNGFVNVAAPEIKNFIAGSETPPAAPRGGGVVIRGVSVVGHPLTCTPGIWSNNPTFTYDFIDSANRQLLQRGESATYALSEADVGRTIYCEVEASNAGGTGLVRTLALAPIKPAPPPPPVPGPPPEAQSPPPAGGVLASTAASVGAAQIEALLKRELTPSGKGAKIAALLRSGGLTILFQALEAGTVVISWYQVPPGAKPARKAKPVLVASGRATFSAAGRQKIKLKLTSAGKRQLERAGSLKLTAKGSFTPPGEAPVTATKAFVLKR